MPNTTESEASVIATVELTGEYEQIAEIIGTAGREYEEVAVISNDLETVVEIIAQTGGATKSRIVKELPVDVSAEVDSDTVIHMLRVLELYDLVILDGNTWRPGPALSSN